MRVKCALLVLIWVTSRGTASPAQVKPLNQADVLALLIAGTDSEDVVHLIQLRGLDFSSANKYLRTLRDAGAKEVLLATVGATKQTVSPKPDRTPAADRAVLARVRNCARLELRLPWWEGRKKAERECRAALKYAPDDPFLLLATGSIVGGLGRPEEAIALYRHALDLDPNLAAAHVNIANGFLYRNFHNEDHTADAIAEFREAIRIDPDYAAAHWRLASALADRGETDAAIAEYQAGLRLQPNSVGLHRSFAALLSTKGDLKGAVAEYREVVLLQPDATSHSRLGYALFKEDDLEGAILEYREALRLDPADSSALHDALGYLLEEKGDIDGAIGEYRQALFRDPKLALAHFGLGQAYEKKGDFPLALDEYRAAAQLEPTNAKFVERYETLTRKLTL